MTKREALVEALGFELTEEAKEVIEKMITQLDRPRSMGPKEKEKQEKAAELREKIVAFVTKHPGVPAKEIAAHCGKATSGVVGQLTKLTKQGVLVKEKGARAKDPNVYSLA